MSNEMHHLLKTDFLAFAGKAMRELEGTTLSDDRYLEVVADRLMKLHRGETRRLLINMPPRHAKTFLASVCFAAWQLGQRPNTKILIVTYADALAEAIARTVRSLMGAQFYKDCFPTRLQKGHASATNFATTRGGEVRATTIHGSVTGFGADVIIVDDPHNATDAGHPKKLAATIEKFQTNVMTRLNNRNKGAVVVVAHRIHERDLSANLISDGGWDHVVLPQIATRDQTYRTGGGTWHRRKGTLLQPEKDNFEDIERKRQGLVNPSFDLLYQQDVDGQACPAICEDHFPFYSTEELRNARYVVSVDPGTDADEGDRRSFSVVQVWADDGRNHFLIDQFRDKCDFYELGRMTQRFARRYRVTTILIEQTAIGPALKSELTRKQTKRVEGVTPRGSKRARFRRHVEKIVAGCIRLPKDNPICRELVKEFIQFPHGRFTDQVDAFTQYADWCEKHPFDGRSGNPTATNAYIAVGLHSQFTPTPPSATASANGSKGIMVAKGNSHGNHFGRPFPPLLLR